MWYVEAFLCCANFSFTICIVCGACKEGELIPLFTFKAQTQYPQVESECSFQATRYIIYDYRFCVACVTYETYINYADSPCATPGKKQIEDLESEPESDILILSKSLASTSLA